MADSLSVSFGPVMLGAYHMAIETTYDGVSEITQAQSTIGFTDASLVGILGQAFGHFGEPLGNLFSATKVTMPEDSNSLLPKAIIVIYDPVFENMSTIHIRPTRRV